MSSIFLETNRVAIPRQMPIQINQSVVSRITEVIRSLPVGARLLAKDIAEAIPGVSHAAACCTLKTIAKHNLLTAVGELPSVGKGRASIVWQVTPWNRNWVPNASPRGMARSLNY